VFKNIYRVGENDLLKPFIMQYYKEGDYFALSMTNITSIYLKIIF
jgi:hypothetical protein